MFSFSSDMSVILIPIFNFFHSRFNITSFINELVPKFFSELKIETRLKWLHKRRTFSSLLFSVNSPIFVFFCACLFFPRWSFAPSSSLSSSKSSSSSSSFDEDLTSSLHKEECLFLVSSSYWISSHFRCFKTFLWFLYYKILLLLFVLCPETKTKESS